MISRSPAASRVACQCLLLDYMLHQIGQARETAQLVSKLSKESRDRAPEGEA